MHHIEHMMQVPYRYSKNFTGQVTINEKTYTDTYEFYVRDEKLNVHSYPTRLGDRLLEMQLMRFVECDSGRIYCVKAQDVYEVAINSLSKDQYYLLKSNPNDVE